MKRLNYWMRWAGETASISLIITAGLLLFNTVTGYRGNGSGALTDYLLMMAPIQLLFCSIFVISIVLASFFQANLPVLISMNCTRKEALVGVLTVPLAELAVLSAAVCGLWMAGPDQTEHVSDPRTMFLILGAGLIVISLFLTMGAVMIRWGKIGMVLAAILYMIVGGVFGGGVAAMRGEVVTALADSGLIGAALGKTGLVLAVGVILYAAASAVVAYVVRKYEVKV